MTEIEDTDFDPHIDRVAAARWAEMPKYVPAAGVPWLHEEVGRRMAERLDYIKLSTKDWTNWSWQRGGGFRQAQSERLLGLQNERFFGLQKLWTGLNRLIPFGLSLSRPSFRHPADLSQDMIWSNMQLHMEAAPKRMIAAWHAALKTDGFVMFSCLGPDTLMELRAAYERRSWPAPMHTMTDMHDWGDRLVAQGFAEPVMDMERLVLTFATPERAVQELRELGRNLNPKRAHLASGASLQAIWNKGWQASLLAALDECRNADGQIALTFELIYGHAMKPKPRVKLSPSSAVSLAQMREMLKG